MDYLKHCTSTVPSLGSRAPAIDGVLKKLRVSEDVREIMKQHIALVGLDYHRFECTPLDQGLCLLNGMILYPSTGCFLDHAFELLTLLDLHIPTEIDRDVRSKLVVITSDKNTVKSTDRKHMYTRWRRVYQCSCGIDNVVGHHGGKKREISWANVGCGAWFHLTTTHDEENKDSMFSSFI
jgi:hypothetical protein